MRLEPYEGKLSRTVLRGGVDGNAAPLPDFPVVAWQRLGEICAQHLGKGSKVYIEGRLQTRSWEGQDGQKRYATEIIANDLIMLDSRQAAGVASGRAGGDELEDIPMDGADIPF